MLRGWDIAEGGVGGNDVSDDGEGGGHDGEHGGESVDEGWRDEDGEDGVGAELSSEPSSSSIHSCGSAVQSEVTKSRGGSSGVSGVTASEGGKGAARGSVEISHTLPADCSLDDKVEAALVLRVVRLCLGGRMVEASLVSLCSLCL